MEVRRLESHNIVSLTRDTHTADPLRTAATQNFHSCSQMCFILMPTGLPAYPRAGLLEDRKKDYKQQLMPIPPNSKPLTNISAVAVIAARLHLNNRRAFQ